MITTTQAIALARYIEPIRPDWDFHGIKSAIESHLAQLDARSAADAALACATDPTARTPGAMSNPIYRTGGYQAPRRGLPHDGETRAERIARQRAVLEAMTIEPRDRIVDAADTDRAIRAVGTAAADAIDRWPEPTQPEGPDAETRARYREQLRTALSQNRTQT